MPKWSMLEIEGVNEAVTRAAKAVANNWDSKVDVEDLRQEAYFILCSKEDAAMDVLNAGGLGRLYHWLRCDLSNYAQSEVRRTQLNFPWDDLVAYNTEGA